MANKGSVNYLTFVFGLHELFFSLEGGGLDSQCCLSGVRNLLNSRSRDGFFKELKGWGGVWAQPSAIFFMLFYVFYIIFLLIFVILIIFHPFLPMISSLTHQFLVFRGAVICQPRGTPRQLRPCLYLYLTNRRYV